MNSYFLRLTTRGRTAALLLFLFLLACCAGPEAGCCTPQETTASAKESDETAPLVVNTTRGPIRGRQLSSGMLRFTGIPYAASPSGERRWARPQQPEPWNEALDCTEFGPVCIQAWYDKDKQDEDCLYLNLWTPAADDKKRPVMVFIHGGGFIDGGTTNALYHGETFVERGDVVLVTIQYRINVFGFLELESVAGKSLDYSHNLGLLDQVAALQWVHDNIANFGGDPNNVTIFGESAGSISATALMLMPEARKLFHKAIAQSGTYSVGRPIERAREVTRLFLEELEVETLEELRQTDVAELRKALIGLLEVAGTLREVLLFEPDFDGAMLPQNPRQAFAQGAASSIDLMHGTTLDEYHLWLMLDEDGILASDPDGVISGLLTEYPMLHSTCQHSAAMAAQMLSTMRTHAPDRSKLDSALDVLTWEWFRYPHIRLAEEQSRHSKVWSYRMDWGRGLSPYGAMHGMDLLLTFNPKNHANYESHLGLEEDLGEFPTELATAFQDAWIQFARKGDPNHAKLPAWKAYDSTDRATMIFNQTSRVDNDPEGPLRAAWAKLHKSSAVGCN